ncbi:MAG: hypothetical protein LBV19_02380, partial [Streptococcaceae bacterium]|nr:hypothetical protein [Streptococcaceae bacterium]
MKKKLFYLILLLLAVFSFGSLKAQAATSASGVWSDESTADGATGLNWTFDADTGTLSFTS